MLSQCDLGNNDPNLRDKKGRYGKNVQIKKNNFDRNHIIVFVDTNKQLCFLLIFKKKKKHLKIEYKINQF